MLPACIQSRLMSPEPSPVTNPKYGERTMTTIQAKPVNEVAGGPQSYPLASTAINVAQPTRIRYLRFALQLVGLIFVFGIYTLSIVWPSGWVWHTGHTSHY